MDKPVDADNKNNSSKENNAKMEKVETKVGVKKNVPNQKVNPIGLRLGINKSWNPDGLQKKTTLNLKKKIRT